MEKDEEGREGGPGEAKDPKEPAESGEPTAELAGEEEEETEEATGSEAEPVAGRPPMESGRNLRVAAISGAVLLFALAFFMAGFFVHSQMDGDDGDQTATGDTFANASDDPSWGPENAPVVIQEFADFQCPYCSEFALQTLPSLQQAYGDKIRFVYRDFPLTSIHENAEKAAEAAQCAQDQGLFWEYHNLLFQHQDALAVSDLKQYAQTVGADTDEFDQCLDGGKNAWEVLLDSRDGNTAGVSGTPAFLVNGLLLGGTRPFEQFQAIIESALAGSGG